MNKRKDPIPDWQKMYTVALYRYWGMTWKEVAKNFFPDKQSLQRFRSKYDKLARIMTLGANQRKRCSNCNEPLEEKYKINRLDWQDAYEERILVTREHMLREYLNDGIAKTK